MCAPAPCYNTLRIVMRIALSGFLAVALVALGWNAAAQTTTAKKTGAPKAAQTTTAKKPATAVASKTAAPNRTAATASKTGAGRGTAAAHKPAITGKPATMAARTTTARRPIATSARRGARATVPPRKTWRNRQAAPTPERYKEIQQALAAKGYLDPEAATGTWDQTSIVALKRFQTSQNIEATGKLNSLSLIALGLGPKHDSAAPTPVPVPPPVPPADNRVPDAR